jgi:type II secretory pathway component PulL
MSDKVTIIQQLKRIALQSDSLLPEHFQLVIVSHFASLDRFAFSKLNVLAQRMQITMTARSEAYTVFYLSSSEIVCSNPIRTKDSCDSSVSVLLCLAMGRSPHYGVLHGVYKQDSETQNSWRTWTALVCLVIQQQQQAQRLFVLLDSTYKTARGQTFFL